MLLKAFVLLTSIGLQVTARPSRSQYSLKPTVTDEDDDDGCPKVSFIGIRGTLESPGFGAMQPLFNRFDKDFPGSESNAIDYPASGITIGKDDQPIYNPLAYISSVIAGRSALANEVYTINAFCPKTPLVLLAYSQGAHVLGDVVCGSKFIFLPEYGGLEPEAKSSIKAIVTLGDPTNTNGTTSPAHIGNSTQSGIFDRQTWSDCGDSILNSWKTYCDANDTFCDSGSSVDAHLHYVSTYFDDIIAFVEGKLGQSQPKSAYSLVESFWEL